MALLDAPHNLIGEVTEDIPPTVVREESSGGGAASWPLLVGGFVAAFVCACAALLLLGHYTLHSPRSLSPFTPALIDSDDHGGQELPSLVVSGPGFFRKAQVGEKINPAPGKDYTFFVWVKLRKVPRPGDVYAVLGKFDAQVPNKPGYALSLEGALDGVRPRVYLSSGSDAAKWYTFTAYPMTRKHWYLIAVSISQDTFVSTYVGQHGSEQEAVLLGGHRINLPSLPYSASDVLVGAFGSSRFRGQIGPFGVISGKRLQKQLPAYLTEMQSARDGGFEVLPSESVQLWGSPFQDLSKNHYEVVEGRPAEVQPSLAAPRTVKPKVSSKSTADAKKTAKKKRSVKIVRAKPKKSKK